MTLRTCQASRPKVLGRIVVGLVMKIEDAIDNTASRVKRDVTTRPAHAGDDVLSLAMTGFRYSGVGKSMTFAAQDSNFFWSNGYCWGKCSLKKTSNDVHVELSVFHGQLQLSKFVLRQFGEQQFDEALRIKTGQMARFSVSIAK